MTTTLPTETLRDLTKAARKGDWGAVMGSTLTLRNFTFAVMTGGISVQAVPARSKTAFRKAAEAAREAVATARPKGRSPRTVAGGRLTSGQAANAAAHELDIAGSLVG